MTEFHIRNEEMDASAIMSAPPGSSDAKLLKMLGTHLPMSIIAIEDPIVGKLVKGLHYPVQCLHIVHDHTAYRVAIHYTKRITINLIGIKDQYIEDIDFAAINMISAVLDFVNIPHNAVNREVVVWITDGTIHSFKPMIVDIAYLGMNRKLASITDMPMCSLEDIGVVATPMHYLQEFGCLPSAGLPSNTLGA